MTVTIVHKIITFVQRFVCNRKTARYLAAVFWSCAIMYGNHFQRKYSREPPILGWSTFIGFVAAVVQTGIAICERSHGHENIALAYFAAVNLFTYVVNSVDKCIAQKDDPCCYRVPEILLHFFTIAGGAPATAFAMWPPLDHKCSKRPYQNWYICCAITSLVTTLCFIAVK